MTFRWPCIVINSYNKTQLDALISQTYFWNKTLHVSDSSSVHHQEFFTVHTAMVHVIQVFWQLASRPARKLLVNLVGFIISRFGKILLLSLIFFFAYIVTSVVCHQILRTEREMLKYSVYTTLYKKYLKWDAMQRNFPRMPPKTVIMSSTTCIGTNASLIPPAHLDQYQT